MTLTEIEQELIANNPSYLSDFGGVGLGKIAPFMEAAVLGMSKRDWVSVGQRGQSVAALRGASVSTIANGSPSYKVAPSVGSAGQRALQSIGLAIASARPVLCLLSNSALSDGKFVEALNAASLKQAPVLFVVLERNTSNMPISPALTVGITVLASALGVESQTVSTQDELRTAVEAARESTLSNGPSLIHITV